MRRSRVARQRYLLSGAKGKAPRTRPHRSASEGLVARLALGSTTATRGHDHRGGLRGSKGRQDLNLQPSASKADALSIERRGRDRAQGHVGRNACLELDPSALKHGTDYPCVGNRDQRLTIDALGPRKRLRAKLARTSEKPSVPAQQAPSCSDLRASNHIRPLALGCQRIRRNRGRVAAQAACRRLDLLSALALP